MEDFTSQFAHGRASAIARWLRGRRHKPRAAQAASQRVLQLEQLEPRTLLSSGALLAARLPSFFQTSSGLDYGPFRSKVEFDGPQVVQNAALLLNCQSGNPISAPLASNIPWYAGKASTITGPVLPHTSKLVQVQTSVVQPAVVVSTSGSSRTVTPADSGIAANYVIITTAAIQAGSTNLAAFVANQQARGYTVAVETEGSWGGGVGNSAADNIRNWLTANYVSMGIQYVLLVGNPDPTAGDVPMKITWPMGPGGMQAPTDFYYANLTNIWDANGDGKPGEWGSDFTSVPATQVTVGRIPVDAADYASLDAILAKTISYENSSNTAWRKSMLLPIGISNYYNEDGAAVARTDGSSLGEAIKNNLAAPGGYSAYTMYEKSGLQPVTTASNAALTEANVVNQWSTTPYGIVDWWSHGDASDADRYVWTADSNHDGTPQSSEMSYTPFFTSSDAAALNNNYPSIVVQVACDNGDPQDSSNLGYALLKQGAVATFCASAYTWYSQGPWSPSLGLTYGDDASYAYYITQQLTAAPLAATTGAALQWCRANFGTGWADGSSWMNALAMNLDGDPSLSLLPPAQIHGTAVNDANGNGAWDAGEPGVSGRTVFLDDNNDGRPDGGTNTLASGNVNLAIPDGVGNLTATQALGGVSASISSVTVTLNITHSFDSDLTAYLVSPAGVQIQLFSHVGGSGTNFTNTVFSDAASTAIAAGAAPFSGSFRPAQPLSVLDGLSPDGTWQLIVADGVSGDSGTLNNWTLTINTQERSTTTDANGSYVFNNLTPGTYRVRLVAQSGWQNTAPTSGEQDVTLGAGQNMTGANFWPTKPWRASPSPRPAGLPPTAPSSLRPRPWIPPARHWSTSLHSPGRSTAAGQSTTVAFSRRHTPTVQPPSWPRAAPCRDRAR